MTDPAVTNPPTINGRPSATEPPTSWWVLAAAALAWCALWFLTPGLRADGHGSLFSTDDATAVLIETCIALAVVLVLVATHRRYNRILFAPSWAMWLYVPLVGTAVALPFHYELYFPVALYMFWMTVSVFWQDYLTFGLLQSYLSERLPTWATIIATGAIFWLGHVLMLPHRFGLEHLMPSLAILALGLVLASLRGWLGNLHLILALHLAFYFVFA